MGGSEISNFTPEKISQEVEKLKTELKEKEKAIEDLKKIAPVNAASGPSDESKKLEEKIKELEGRLQEYEIISEDIADLSFYKEENNRLQKELGEAKGGSSAAIPKASESSSPKIEATAIPAVNETATVSAPVIEAPAPIPASTTAPAPTTEPSIPAVSASEKVIDDDILKEFAAAVEGQKNTEQQQQPVKELDPQKITESKELMGEFENFIKKG